MTITVLRDEAYWVPILMKNVNGGSSGGTSITVIGMAFRTFDPTGSIRLGGSACTTTEWVAETTMVCLLAPGSGTLLELSVTIIGTGLDSEGNQAFNIGTLEEAFQYDKPVPEGEREALAVKCLASGTAGAAGGGGGSSCAATEPPQASTNSGSTYPCTLPWVWRQKWHRNATCFDRSLNLCLNPVPKPYV